LSYGNYQATPIRQAINLAKYHGVWAGLLPLARQAWTSRWHRLPDQSWSYVIPLALDARRQRARGFNQSYYLAQVLSRHLGVPIGQQLRRVRKTAQQVGLNRADRHRNMEGVFAWHGQQLFGNVILVDDVVTTSATLASAALALHKAGAESVWACTLAYEALRS
jgi:ComF family protein